MLQEVYKTESFYRKDGARELLTKENKRLFLDWDRLGVTEGTARAFIMQIAFSSFWQGGGP